MKTKLFFWSLVGILTFQNIEAQNRANINAVNSQISADLDLKSIARIFGEAQNLEDFEIRLNDPEYQISNLDLNEDNEVDYLRVVESIENRSHLIVIQAVLDHTLFQDVATITLEKNNLNSAPITIIGNQSLFGSNYYYRPVLHRNSIILNLIWKSNYRPYYSNWRWKKYPNSFCSRKPFGAIKFRHNKRAPFNLYHYRSIPKQNRNYYPVSNQSNFNKRIEITKQNNRRANYQNNSRPIVPIPEQENKVALKLNEIEIHNRKTQYVDIPKKSENSENSRQISRRN